MYYSGPVERRFGKIGKREREWRVKKKKNSGQCRRNFGGWGGG